MFVRTFSYPLFLITATASGIESTATLSVSLLSYSFSFSKNSLCQSQYKIKQENMKVTIDMYIHKMTKIGIFQMPNLYEAEQM